MKKILVGFTSFSLYRPKIDKKICLVRIDSKFSFIKKKLLSIRGQQFFFSWAVFTKGNCQQNYHRTPPNAQEKRSSSGLHQLPVSRQKAFGVSVTELGLVPASSQSVLSVPLKNGTLPLPPICGLQGRLGAVFENVLL
jgi:hypothetical protein